MDREGLEVAMGVAVLAAMVAQRYLGSKRKMVDDDGEDAIFPTSGWPHWLGALTQAEQL